MNKKYIGLFKISLATTRSQSPMMGLREKREDLLPIFLTRSRKNLARPVSCLLSLSLPGIIS